MNKEFQQYDNVYKANNIFPPSWKVDEKLCEEFCFATRTQLGELLEKAREDNLLTVDEIVVALTKTGIKWTILQTQKQTSEILFFSISWIWEWIGK